MQILMKIVSFVVLLGGLVFFHELGHFLIAKLCKVKVLKFSLGFGPRVWGFRRGETEYQIAALPLGGYVKMLGEDPSVELPPEDRGRGFSQQKPYKRAAIAFAGPAMNLLLAPIVYCAIFMSPQPQDPPIVGRVLHGEAAERAGVLPGDRIVSVDGEPTRSFDEMKEVIEERSGQNIDLVVQRGGETKTLRVTPTSEAEKDLIQTTQKGRIGVVVGRLAPYVAVVPGSRAFQAGLRTFDKVIAIDGRKLPTVADLDAVLKTIPAGKGFNASVIRGRTVDLKTSTISTGDILSFTIPDGPGPLGFDDPTLYVREVSPDSAAWAAGLRPLDKVVSVDGKPVESTMRFEQLTLDRTRWVLEVERGDQKVPVAFNVKTTTRQDAILGPLPITEMGFSFHPGVLAREPYPDSERVMVSYPFPQALERSVKAAYLATHAELTGIGAIFTGRVSARNVGGPIQIFQLTSTYSEQGLVAFLTLFALVSINLGLVNLFPVPILDGFHIVIAVVEGVSRRMVPLKAREFANYVGLAMLLALMALAFTNDIRRVLGL